MVRINITGYPFYYTILFWMSKFSREAQELTNAFSTYINDYRGGSKFRIGVTYRGAHNWLNLEITGDVGLITQNKDGWLEGGGM